MQTRKPTPEEMAQRRLTIIVNTVKAHTGGTDMLLIRDASSLFKFRPTSKLARSVRRWLRRREIIENA